MTRSKAKHLTYVLAHIALFIIFFWFGFLKVIDMSPATPLVDALRALTIPWWPMASFGIFLGTVEMFTGILFLFKRTEKVAAYILVPHMITTFLPLVMLPGLTFQSLLVPTLEGQYIIKNLVIMALAASIVVGYRKSKAEK
jgi:uncharacterized membrane protein YkgB